MEKEGGRERGGGGGVGGGGGGDGFWQRLENLWSDECDSN